MELRHLRYFIAAAEAENVSRAALKLHVSQPALSRQIHDLEAELEVSLFERTAKSVRLTEAGRLFLVEARAVIERAEQARQAARSCAQTASYELHIGYAPSPTVRLLPAVLRAFQPTAAGIRVRLHDLSTEEMLAGVRSGDLHLAFMVHPGRALLRGLHFEGLAQDTMRVAVAPGHAWARLRSVSSREVAGEPLVVFSRRDYPEYHAYLGRVFAPLKIVPRIAEEHDGSASLIAAIESGAGIAVLPESFGCTAGTRLRLIPLVPDPEPLVIGAVWAEKKLSPPAEAFLKCARRAGSMVRS